MMIEDLSLGIPEDSHAAYRLGITRANLDARIAAFAAIRRAAEVAREPDLRRSREAIRYAVCAAIGSEKTVKA